MRAPLDRQREYKVIDSDYYDITAAPAGDAWSLHVDLPDGDIAKNHMVYITNLSTESDFDLSIGNKVVSSGIPAFAQIQTQHVSKASLTLLDKTAWNSCYKEKGAVLTDYSAEAESAAANDVIFDFSAVDHALYFGAPNKFTSLYRSAGTAGVYSASMAWEYWDGNSWEELEDLASASQGGAGNPAQPFITATAAFIRWTVPEDWAKLNPDGDPVEQYWIRCRVDSFTSITTAPRISRLYQTPAKNYNSYGYVVPNMFNGSDAEIRIANETQITLPCRVYIEVREI